MTGANRKFQSVNVTVAATSAGNLKNSLLVASIWNAAFDSTSSGKKEQRAEEPV